MTPVHEHDCDACVYIGSYPMRHPYIDDEYGYRTGVPFKHVGMADIYYTCDPGPSFYKFIVRYGIHGEYATTNQPHIYVKAPWVDGVDDFAKPDPDWYKAVESEDGPLSVDIFAVLGSSPATPTDDDDKE